jgi:hypothetical protein
MDVKRKRDVCSEPFDHPLQAIADFIFAFAR